MQHRQAGFTLIELMIVIAILSVLISIAIPAYQNYTIRTKVSEGINGANWLKFAVVETFQSTGSVADQAATGADILNTQTQYVDSIQVAGDGSGTITITTRNTGAQPDVILSLTPTLVAGETIQWTCATVQGQPQHVPSECR